MNASLVQFLPALPLKDWDGALIEVIKIAVILAAAYLVVRLVDRAIDRALEVKRDPASTNPRLVTVSNLFQSIVNYTVVFVALVLILHELGINTSSLLASAGILGLIVGLGAQSLIKDLISGFFIIIEDQYRVGDMVRIGNFTGTVTEMGMRMTRLTDWNGEVHNIPNGQIATVTNLSRAPRAAVVDIRVPYLEDVSRVLGILNEVAKEASITYDYLKEEPKVQGITELGDTNLVIRMVVMTEPNRQWEMERALRLMIKKRFEQEGIGAPVSLGTLLAKRDGDGAKKV